MTVVDAEDREIGRVHDRNRRERSDIHQQLAVAGDDKHTPVRTGERKAQADHAGSAHRARHRVGVRPVSGQSRDVAARAREAADDQKILVPTDQGRNRIAPVEDELRVGRPPVAVIGHHPRSPQNCFAPSSFWVSSTATA
jgi:hypothetical protein